jgi:hypothetical protein
MSFIGFVVMPPGHGKSYRHLSLPGLVEADTLVDCKATENLRRERVRAKEIGYWKEYDNIWANAIAEKLEDGARYVVMVPAIEVGEVLGWTYLGSAVLSDIQWEVNTKSRPGFFAKWGWIKRKSLEDGAIQLQSNDDLTNWLANITKEWMGLEN